MAGVFISYSREDQEFVRRLYRALATAHRDAWVDWEGIPPTAEWLKEIYGAIDAADAFVCVLSPAFLASAVCGQELQHAVDARKRIVPLVCRDVATPDAPESVRVLNWILFRPRDDFDAAFGKLIAALDTDLDYWHAAAQYLVRARQWEARGENASFVLRGSDLAEAERWLAEGATQLPTPTALHVRYITASRRAAARQQRRTIGLLSTASTVMAALAVVALVFANVARVQSDRATQQRDDAVFNLLMAQYNLALDTQPDRAMLYALEANRFRNNLASRTALFGALERYPYLATALQNGDAETNLQGVTDLAFSADGQTLLSVDGRPANSGASDRGESQFTLWDVATGQQRVRFTTAFAVDASALSPNGRIVAIGPSGQGVASGAAYEPVELWDATTGTRLARLSEGFSGGSRSLSFSPDGTLLAADDCADAACSATQITLWNVASLAPARQFQVADNKANVLLAFSPDGKYLAIQGAFQVMLWDTASGRVTSTYFAQGDPVAFGAKGKTLVIGGCGNPSCTAGSAELIDLATGQPIGAPFADSAGGIGAVALSPDGQTLITGARPHTLRLWNVTTGAWTELFGHSGEILDLTFSPDGRYFASGGADNKVLLWHTTAFTPLSRALSPQFDATYGMSNWADNAFAFSPDGKSFAIGDCSERIALWATMTGAPGTTLGPPPGGNGISCVGDLAFSRDGSKLAVDEYPGPYILELATGRVQALSGASDSTVGAGILTFSPDGRFLATSGSMNAVTVWDTATGTSVETVPGASANRFETGAAFSPDGRLLAMSGTGDAVTLVDGHDFKPVATRPVPAASDAYVAQVAFSPDGETLAALGSTGTITLWRAKTLTRTGSFQALQNNDPDAAINTSLAFSPDGQVLAAGLGQDFGLWYAATHEPVIAQQRADSEVTNLAFSPDGRLLAEATLGGPLLVRYATQALWQAQACTIAGRNFTSAEWRQVFDTDPYQKVCPSLPGPSSA